MGETNEPKISLQWWHGGCGGFFEVRETKADVIMRDDCLLLAWSSGVTGT